MIRPWHKICGLTRLEDAQAAIEYGARALGFILFPESPRYIDPELAHEIIERLPPRIAKVAVTVNAPVEFVWDLKFKHGFTVVQAHGEESPEECARYPLPVIKAIRCTPDLEVYDLQPYAGYPLVLDGYSGALRGGTGKESDWELAAMLKNEGFKIVLAGGLGAHNVLSAIEAVEPHALDFNSLVESRPGIKDHGKLKEIYELLNPLDEPEREAWPW